MEREGRAEPEPRHEKTDQKSRMEGEETLGIGPFRTSPPMALMLVFGLGFGCGMMTCAGMCEEDSGWNQWNPVATMMALRRIHINPWMQMLSPDTVGAARAGMVALSGAGLSGVAFLAGPGKVKAVVGMLASRALEVQEARNGEIASAFTPERKRRKVPRGNCLPMTPERGRKQRGGETGEVPIVVYSSAANEWLNENETPPRTRHVPLSIYQRGGYDIALDQDAGGRRVLGHTIVKNISPLVHTLGNVRGRAVRYMDHPVPCLPSGSGS